MAEYKRKQGNEQRMRRKETLSFDVDIRQC